MDTGRPGVLLDRDGTLIEERHYLSDPAEVALLPGAAAAVCRLNRAGLPVALVTNQSGVARGFFDLDAVARVHARLAELLAAQGARLDFVAACPHHPDHGGSCACRKPAPGMAHDAARALGLDLARCVVVGDKRADLGLAAAVGARGILVRTGHGAAEEAALDAAARAEVAVVDDLAAAVEGLLTTTPRKVVARDEFVARCLAARAAGRRVVFTNGCFDLLHVGHLRYLEAARGRGDMLVVAVNTDASVRALKGPTRPLVPDTERQEMLAGLACVDLVTGFHEETPYELIKACRPARLVKGADWAGQVVGTDLVEADGGEVQLIRLVPGRSSTGLIARAGAAAAAEAKAKAEASPAAGAPPPEPADPGSSPPGAA